MIDFTPAPFPIRPDRDVYGTSSQLLHPVPAALSALSAGPSTDTGDMGTVTSDSFLAGLQANKFQYLLRNRLVS